MQLKFLTLDENLNDFVEFSPSIDFTIFSIHTASIRIGSLNFIVTIFIIKNFSLNYDNINLFS